MGNIKYYRVKKITNKWKRDIKGILGKENTKYQWSEMEEWHVEERTWDIMMKVYNYARENHRGAYCSGFFITENIHKKKFIIFTI